VKRDPPVLDLVLFLHPKKCLTCGCEKFALLLVLETVPGTFAWLFFGRLADTDPSSAYLSA